MELLKKIKAKGMLLLLIMGLSGCGFIDPCDNEILYENLSPDKQFKAVVFSRNCGATTGFNTQVSILPANKSLPDDGGNVFIIDGQSPVDVRWGDDRHLHIDFNSLEEIYKQEASLEGVEITYDKR